MTEQTISDATFGSRVISSGSSITARQYFTALVVISAVWCLLPLSYETIFSGDESRTAGICAQMMIEGNYVVPLLNGKPFLEYPPLFYWVCIASMKIFGYNDFALSLPSALCAWGGVLMMFFLARKLSFSGFASFLSGVLLMSSGRYFTNGQECRTDMMLSFFIITAIAGFAAWLRAESAKEKVMYWLMTAVAMGLSVMTKGPLGLAMSGAATGGFVIADDILCHKFRWKRYLYLGAAGLASLLPLMIWILLLFRQQGGDGIFTVLIANTVGRFAGGQADHAQPFYSYFLALPGFFQPWLIFLLGGLCYAVRKIIRDKDSRRLFCVSSLIVPFLLLCCASGKRLIYLLPLGCGCALITADFMEFLLTKYFRPEKYNLKKCFFITCSALIVFGVLAVFFSGLVHQKRAKDNDLRPFFNMVKEVSEKENLPLYLTDRFQERTAGAAWYYLKHGLPVRQRKEYDGKTPELWIIRTRNEGGLCGADWHKLYHVPAEFKQTEMKARKKK